MTIELLDKAKQVTGSDSKTASMIGMTKQHLSGVRHGSRSLSPYQAAMIAEIIGQRWHDHALPVLAANAKTAKERSYWLGKFEALGKTAETATVGAFLIIGAGLLYQAGNASEKANYPSNGLTDYTLRII